MKKLSLLLTLLASIFVFRIAAQVNLSLIIRTPTPAEISEWQQDPSVAQLVITNTSTAEYPGAFCLIKIINEKGVIVAQTERNSKFLPKINIPAGPTTLVLNGPQLINVNSISYDQKIKPIALTTNAIPEGQYQVCISVFDRYGNNITTGVEYCTTIYIMIPDPPTLISPVGDETISSEFPVFTWTPVTNIQPGAIVKYKLKICPVFEGQSPRTAIESNPVLLEKNDLFNSSYQYLPSDLPFNYFQQAIRYVWMVQAFDQNGRPATRNQGKSELATFTLPSAIGETITLNGVFPANNDTIPWNTPQLIVRFAPYTDNIRSVNYTLQVRKVSTDDRFSHTRTLSFPSGPQSSQGLSSTDQASLIITNLNDSRNFPEWMQNLETGVKYSWRVEATFTMADGTSATASSGENYFVIGFKKPVNIYPSADTIIRAKSNFNIIFSVPGPELLNFSHTEILNQPSFHGYNAFANASGKYSIEFSKKMAFDSIYRTVNINLPSGSPYRSGDNCENLYGMIRKQISSINDTGKYYWRLKCLNSTGDVVYTAPVRAMRIVPDTSYSCFEMKAETPVNGGRWTTNNKPRFSVSVKPQINKSAITGGRIKVWKMTSPTQDIAIAKSGRAVLDTTFTGSDNSKIFAYSTDMAGFTRYDLNFINGDSSSVTFSADSGSTYLWNFYLNYKKDSVRTDRVSCDSNMVVSDDATFTVSPVLASSDSGSCPGDCYATVPTNRTPATHTFAADSVIKIGTFDLKLTTVSGTGSSLSGEGSIDVPYLRAPILVEFNGIKVNTSNEVFEGEVYAKIVDGAPYSKPEGNDFEGQALSFAADKLKFQQIHEYSGSLGRLVSTLTGTTPVGLPIGFDRDYDGYKVIIGIIGMKFTPSQAVLNAAMYVELPALGPDVGFGLGAKNICFHKDGIAGSGKGILYLAQDFGYRNEGTWSFLFKAPTPSDSGTYAVWDCHGFNQLVIAADVEFPRSWLKPVPDSDPTKLVKAHFKTRADKSGAGWQWLASANLEECEISSVDGFKLQVQEMAFDYSTVRNPEGIVFPANYTGTTNNEWKGFYIKRASITFPDKLKTFEDRNPILSVNHMIIDRTGFTATIQGENIIQYPTGNFGEWGASIDSVKIKLVSSSLQSGQMKGRLKISIADSSLLYTGTISRPSGGGSLKYMFSIVPQDTIKADIWKCKLSLLPTSRIELGDTSGSFLAQAVLNGSFTLNGDVGGISKLGFKGVSFEGFKVMSASPYIEKGNWSLASPQHSMAGFPVSINNLNIVTGSRGGSAGAGIQFTLAVNLQPGSSAISGATTLSVWGKMSSGSGPQRFVFDGIDLDSIGIDADLGAVIISGGVRLYNSHPTFGNGFRGALNATFVDQIAISATAQFGSVNDYRYWYVDAKALFSTGIPVFTGVGIYGFGGGAWYHMRKTGAVSLASAPPAPDRSSTPGTSNSGYSYEPDQGVAFGFMGMMVLGTHPSAEAFNGDVSIEAQFLSDGGIGTIAIGGEGYMLCEITNRSSSRIRASVDMEYNFPAHTYHGVFSVNINATPFTGGGQMVLHFSPELWYIKIGEPSNRVNVSLASWLRVDGYFMVGQNLPAPPPLPEEVRELFPGWTVVRNPAIERGDGFAFGASASFNTGRQTFLIFYGELSALIGFDLALLNFGPSATCEGMSGPIGINGWYAMGQIYASVAAAIGLHVDLWFVEGDFEILSLQVGAALQGAGPNPTWVQGAVGGRYRILGGLIKGHCSFEFKKGDECRPIVESPLARIDLISAVDPVNGSTNVDVFTETQAAFNFELDTPFELEEMPTGTESPRIRTFRIKIGDFRLAKEDNYDSVYARLTVSHDKYSAYYTPHDMLQGNTYYRLKVSAYGEEYISGTWQPARRTDNTIIKQVVESRFRTGAAPDNIPESNVAYSYPIRGQRYFLQDECRAGRIQLKSGQPALFTAREGYIARLFARFIPIDLNLQPIEVPYTYNAASKTIFFDVPSLLNNKPYFVQIIKKEEQMQSAQPVMMGQLSPQNMIAGFNPHDAIQNSVNLSERLAYTSGISNLYISRRTISATRVRQGEKLLYVYYFRTSNFNTLQAKLNSFIYVSTDNINPSGIYQSPRARYEGAENFDHFDFHPVIWNQSGSYNYFGPMVSIIGSERSAPWHNNFANPKVYDKIQWMRSKGWWSGNVQFERYLTSSALHFVEVEYNSYQPTLNDIANMILSESAPSSTSTGGGSTSGSSSLLGGFSPGAFSGSVNLSQIQSSLVNPPAPYLILQYNQGCIVPPDYNLMKINAAIILSNPLISKSSSDRTLLNSILSTEYQLMPRGNYPLKYYYNYWGCHGPDDTIPTISKPFVY
jgi:hypothetical protein